MRITTYVEHDEEGKQYTFYDGIGHWNNNSDFMLLYTVDGELEVLAIEDPSQLDAAQAYISLQAGGIAIIGIFAKTNFGAAGIEKMKACFKQRDEELRKQWQEHQAKKMDEEVQLTPDVLGGGE